MTSQGTPKAADHKDNSRFTPTTSLEEKLTNQMQEMERRVEKRFDELHKHRERKEKELIESLTHESREEQARSNERVSMLEQMLKKT